MRHAFDFSMRVKKRKSQEKRNLPSQTDAETKESNSILLQGMHWFPVLQSEQKGCSKASG